MPFDCPGINRVDLGFTMLKRFGGFRAAGAIRRAIVLAVAAVAVAAGFACWWSSMHSAAPAAPPTRPTSQLVTVADVVRQAVAHPRDGLCVPIHSLSIRDGETVEGEIRLRLRLKLHDCFVPVAPASARKAAADHLRAFAEGCDGTIWIPLGPDCLATALASDHLVGQVWLDNDMLSLADHQVINGFAATTKKEASRR
jgi:hypothetical protein